MKKTLFAFAFGALLLASCGGKHDCVCTDSYTRVGETTEEEEGESTIYHDQKDDCSSLNTTRESYDGDELYSTSKTTCVED